VEWAGVAFNCVQDSGISVSSTRSYIITACSVTVGACHVSRRIETVGAVTPYVSAETTIVEPVTLTITHASILSGRAYTSTPPERAAWYTSQDLTLRLNWTLGDIVYNKGIWGATHLVSITITSRDSTL